MAKPLHILIGGERGAGKSTLIEKLLQSNARPVYGFITKRLEADATGFHPIYIHPAGAAERAYTQENLIAMCNSKIHDPALDVFNVLGVRYLEAKPGGIVVMDELGFLESRADAFVKKVMETLDGDIPVLAAVKTRFDVPFLNEVRAHPKAALYTVTPENRDALYEELLPVIQSWNA